MPVLGAFLPFLRLEIVLVTVAKAFLLLLKDPFFPKLVDFFTVAIPTLTALLNLETVFFRAFLARDAVKPGNIGSQKVSGSQGHLVTVRRPLQRLLRQSQALRRAEKPLKQA